MESVNRLFFFVKESRERAARAAASKLSEAGVAGGVLERVRQQDPVGKTVGKAGARPGGGVPEAQPRMQARESLGGLDGVDRQRDALARADELGAVGDAGEDEAERCECEKRRDGAAGEEEAFGDGCLGRGGRSA